MLGTTGEANSFSASERTAPLEAVVHDGIAPKQLLPGTESAALSETITLTRHALSVGVDTVVMLPPFYYKGVTDDGVDASYSEVVQRLGDARLRIVLDDIPEYVGAAAHPARIDRAAARGLSGDLRRDQGFFGRLRQYDRDGRALPGLCGVGRCGSAAPAAAPQGRRGVITATSNLVARDLAYVYKHFRNSDDDAALAAAQARIVKARELVSRFPQMASLKALVAERTGHAGWQRLRPPLESLPAAHLKELLADAGASPLPWAPSAARATRRSDVRILPGESGLVDWLISSAPIASSNLGSDQEPYVVDWRGRYRGRAVAVMKPGSTAEVAAVVRLLCPKGGWRSSRKAATPACAAPLRRMTVRSMS